MKGNHPPQNPHYPDKEYSGLSVDEFIVQATPTFCHDCGRVHGLTVRQINTLLTLREAGELY